MDMNEEYGLTPYETREILFYKTDNGEVRVEILLYQENLWLTQAKMAELFEVQKAAISKHLKNIFTSGELQEEAVVSKMETTAADGKRYNTSYYNLDAIIAVGYRVNSKKATMFRIWANRVLKEFIIKGYVIKSLNLLLFPSVLPIILASSNVFPFLIVHHNNPLHTPPYIDSLSSHSTPTMRPMQLYISTKKSISSL